MTPLESEMYGGLYADPATAALFTDEAEIAAMIRFEAALARVQARLGIIPDDRLAEALEGARVAPADLREGVAQSGIPVPALVAALRALIGEDAQYLHWGATTQDVMDTALMLRLREAFGLIEARLDTICRRLAALADDHRETVMAARTWLQQATPTVFGLKCAIWLDPLIRQRQRLARLDFAVQFGGASGALGASAGRGIETMEALAAEFGLSPAMPWNTSRDRLYEIAAWLAATATALGKIGTDLTLLAQSEIGEVRLGSAGGSSTMPQKQNPVGPYALIALARTVPGDFGAMHMPHAHERDPGAWAAEWLTLPRMACATGAALKIAEETLSGLEPDAARMRANLDASALAEAASFALAAHMPRAEAQALVKAAAREGGNLIDTLATRTDAPVDWDTLRDPARHVGEAGAIIDRVLAGL